jgi:hypothetical protein
MSFKESIMSKSIQVLRNNFAVGLLAVLLGLAAPAFAHACAAEHGTTAERAAAIANGHSFTKHQAEFVQGNVINGLAFPRATIANATAFATFVQAVMTAPSASRGLSNNRIAYWDSTTGTVVIYNPGAADCGTAFRPTAGITYYNNLT